ncbi:hypothetical protein GGR57DRAFT_462054 [Xylariaceae sp. FL1272]|nr:hypothetical protein GGR57DRAFT_462054 [Xylariaceae sp. FL1272]
MPRMIFAGKGRSSVLMALIISAECTSFCGSLCHLSGCRWTTAPLSPSGIAAPIRCRCHSITQKHHFQEGRRRDQPEPS